MRCTAITKAGEQCKNHVLVSGLCQTHFMVEPQEEEEEQEEELPQKTMYLQYYDDQGNVLPPKKRTFSEERVTKHDIVYTRRI